MAGTCGIPFVRNVDAMCAKSFKNACFWLLLISTGFSEVRLAAEPHPDAPKNSFPNPAEVFQGRTFPTTLDRDVFFLRAIHDNYSSQWPALLEANINLNEYLQSPNKMLRFVDEVGIAMADRNDPAASARLGIITSDPNFFANANAYHPEIVRAAAEALIKIGEVGRKALASSFTENHYRQDPESLEQLAGVIGKQRPSDSELAGALSATAFNFSTANGGSYPRCTTLAVKNLLRLPDGASAVRTNLESAKVFGDPGRYQAVMDGIAAARTADLATNLTTLEAAVNTNLGTLTNTPGAYRDDLQELGTRIQKTVAELAKQASGIQ